MTTPTENRTDRTPADPEALAERVAALEHRVEVLEATTVPREVLDAELRRIGQALDELREIEEA